MFTYFPGVLATDPLAGPELAREFEVAHTSFLVLDICSVSFLLGLRVVKLVFYIQSTNTAMVILWRGLRVVSKLVFYVQSTSMVISGRRI